MIQTNKNESKVKKIFIAIVPGFDNEVEAKAEALEFKSAPDIVMNRSAFFPNPVNFHIGYKVDEAVAIKHIEMSGLPPAYGVVVTMTLSGQRGTAEEQRRNINEWIDNAYSKLKSIPGAL